MLQVKLCDFGLARELELDGADLPAGLTTNPGTKSTMAPEVLTDRYDERVDVFSAGCVFYSLLTGKEALRSPDLCIEEGRFPTLYPPPPHGSGLLFSEGSEELDLLRYMTRRALVGPHARPRVADVLAHPFFA